MLLMDNKISGDDIKVTSKNNNPNSRSNTSKLIINNSPSTSPSIVNFSSNKITRRYSITTNDDFNINISINSEEVSTFSNENLSLSGSASYLSKSSCYLSRTDPEDTNLNMNKTLGGSLGSFSPSCGRHLVRTRVSIPPSARNRDRNARPESFRLSSDMASHTRVLLKARSFAGASLRESPTHKVKGGRHFARTSLREDQLSFHRDKSFFGDKARSKMELLSKRFSSTSVQAEGDVCMDQPQDESYDVSLTPQDTDCSSDFHCIPPESFKSASIVIVNSSTDEDHFEMNCKGTDSDLPHSGSISVESYQENVFDNDKITSLSTVGSLLVTEDANCTAKQNVYEGVGSMNDKQKSKVNQPVRQFSLMAPDSYLSDVGQAYQKSQKLRARSFTGMMTPRTLPPLPASPPRETLNEHIPVIKSGTNLKVTEFADSERKLRVTTMTRRARVTRDGYTFRFSSDLGLGSSSKVNARSKREVFV